MKRKLYGNKEFQQMKINHIRKSKLKTATILENLLSDLEKSPDEILNAVYSEYLDQAEQKFGKDFVKKYRERYERLG